jgi:hypothetical protein
VDVRKIRVALAVTAVGLGASLVFYVYVNLREAMNRTASKQTMHNIREIAMAIDRFLGDRQTFPPMAAGPVSRIQGLGAQLSSIPDRDGWGHPIRILAGGNDYVLWSRGSDARDDTQRAAGRVRTHDADIVFSGGQFWTFPEGMTGRPEDLVPDLAEDPFSRVGRKIGSQ